MQFKNLLTIFLVVISLFGCGVSAEKKSSHSSRFIPTTSGELAPQVRTFIAYLERIENKKKGIQAAKTFITKHKFQLPIIKGDSITFVYAGKPGVPVSVVGGFNGWNRIRDIMKEVPGTGIHYLALKLPGAAVDGVHYMLARNCRRTRDFINDPANPVVSFKQANCASWAIPPGYNGGRHIIMHEAFPSKHLKVKPKRIITWLPPSYLNNKSKRYPVLYMHDEQNIWTGKGISHGGWQVDTIAERLIKNGKIKECIIVGLPHSGKTRVPEYSPPYPLNEKVHGKGSPGWGDQYANYLFAVKRYVDKNFRTLPDRKNTAIAGSSMGGLISWYISWIKPDVFGTAGCFSPWFIFRYADLKGGNLQFGKLIAKGPKTKVRYYMDCGDSGWAQDGIKGTMIAKNALIKAGWRLGRDLLFVLEKGAIHNEKAWARRFPKFLEWTFPK